MSSVLYLFLAHLGVGIACTLPLVPKEAGLKFFRFNTGMAAALIAAAITFRPDATLAGASVANTVANPASLTALSVTLGALTLYWITAGRVLTALRPVLLAVGAVAGLATAVLHGLAAASVSGAPLTVISTVTSATLLGGACTAMVLGHWYLILPSMQVSYLQRIVGFHILTLAARVALFAAVLVLAWQEPLPAGQSVRHYVTSLDGIFFWQRALFGLAAPIVLSWLTWETAKIRSTQSATGILYVDFFTVVVGEIMASYVLLSIGLAV